MVKRKKAIQRRHIDALIAIGDNGSVHKAAKELGVPQSVLSRLLSEAEAIFGVALFERSSHGSKPTLQGSEVLTRARFAFRAIQRVENSVIELRPAVQLGCIPRAMHTFMPRLLTHLHPEIALKESSRQAMKSVNLKITEGSSKLLFDLIASGNLDFAILRNLASPTIHHLANDLVVERLYDERTVIVCSASHPDIDGNALSLARLAKYEWALPEVETTSRLAFDQFWSKHNLNQIQPIIEPRSFESNMALVASTKLISIAPESIARTSVKLGVLRIIKTRNALPASPVMLAFKHVAREDPTLSRFRDIIHIIGKAITNR